MRARARLALVLTAATMAAVPAGGAAQVTSDAPAATPAAIVNLANEEGVRLVRGQWRYRDVQIVERLHQASDHPVLLSFPESQYLKGLVCRVA